MMFLRGFIGVLCGLLLPASGIATTLFVSSYAGNITTLSLTASPDGYILHKTFQNSNCGPNPSWLTLDIKQKVLYCVDEGLTVPDGSLSSFSVSSFSVSSDGRLDLVEKASTISGPVNSVIYGKSASRKGIALAHYAGGAVSTWTLDCSIRGSFMLNQNLPQPVNETGPNVDRQEAPHEHQAIVDPTGQYVLVPDLGSDLVRVFAIDPHSLQLSARTPLKMPPGSGPRHAAFSGFRGVVNGSLANYLYVVTELSNTVTGFAVTYPKSGGMSFHGIWNSSVYGPTAVPSGSASAEIVVSPDSRFISVSIRYDKAFTIPLANGSTISSDSISTFQLNDQGSAQFLELAPAGGSVPRQFSMNKEGNLVAVALQGSAEVVLLERNVTSGTIGKQLATVDVEGNVTSVVWWE